MADSLTTLLLLALATYRVSTDLAWESGPGRIFERWRGAVLVRFGGQSSVSEGVTCPICLSLWAGLALTVLAGWLGLYEAWHWPLVWLAASGGAAFLARQKGGE